MKSAGVGRKSRAHSASPKARAYSRHAELSPQSDSGRNLLFTVNLLDRWSDLLVAQIDILREAVARVRANAPFRIDTWVVLPDHMHCLWTLPQAIPISQVGGAQSKSHS